MVDTFLIKKTLACLENEKHYQIYRNVINSNGISTVVALCNEYPSNHDLGLVLFILSILKLVLR